MASERSKMILQQPQSFPTNPLRDDEPRDIPQPIEPPADQDAMMVAAVLHSNCAVISGGSAILVAPESTVPVARTVRRLSRALERLTGEPVLILEFGFDSNTDSSSVQTPATDICTAGGELIAERLLAPTVEKSPPLVGRLNCNHSALLPLVASGRFSQFLVALKTKFRFVMIEGRSLKDSSIGLLLAQACDGVVMTVEYGRTSVRAVVAAQKAARRANVRILGFVLETSHVKPTRR
jgi:hypothetical protein